MKKRVLFCIVGILYSSLLQAQIQKGADIDGESSGDGFGRSVCMPDANTIGIGANLNDGNGVDSGHARIFVWDGTNWVQKGADINGEAAGDRSGFAISMPDANTVAIGALKNNAVLGLEGHVRVYEWSANQWIQKGLDIDGETQQDESGNSISMPNSNTIAIGAFLNDANGPNSSSYGHVRVYTWNGSAWVIKGFEIDGEASGDQSGYSVSMPDENTVAIGAINNDGSGSNAGHVRIFSWNGLAWVQKGLDINGEAAGDQSGFVVSMPDENTVAIGAPYNDGNGADAGQTRIFFWDGAAWVQKGMDINGESVGDRSGFHVSMPDANTIAIGAYLNDGSGIDAGHVRVYKWNGSIWNQVATDINGEFAGDGSGIAVSMPNSNTLAIGAFLNNGIGHSRVYSTCANSAYTFSVSSCDNYVSPSGNYTWNMTGTYTDIIPNALGCDSVLTIDLTIHNIDLSVSENFPNLTANSSGSYQWLDCNNGFSQISGETNQSFTAPANGSYAVEITSNGCLDTSACYLIEELGINELIVPEIKLYPNPSIHEISIEIEAGIDLITINSVSGEQVESYDCNGLQTIAIRPIVNPGIYLVKVTDSTGNLHITHWIKQ